MFTDRVVLELKAGKGGDGVVAWRREKYIPKGGPAGGDGGDGGSIIVQADTQLYSLEALRHARSLRAADGEPGRGSLCHGKDGADLIIKVPCGTWIRHADTQELICDLHQDGQQWVVVAGGKGGRGNDHFKSSTNRTPYQCTSGTWGEELKVIFELKLLADVGLVGFPNAGKSTLLSQIAHINLKTGAYPFTTLYPSIAPISCSWGRHIMLADIPGIIEGAHLNRGLGLEFLRHIERTRLLLFVVDIAGSEGRDPVEDCRTLFAELRAYDPALLEKPRLFVFNKMDLEGAVLRADQVKKELQLGDGEVFEVTALIGEGLEPLIARLKTHPLLVL